MIAKIQNSKNFAIIVKISPSFQNFRNAYENANLHCCFLHRPACIMLHLSVIEVPLQAKLCFICQSTEHVGEHCPTIPIVREMFSNQEIFLVKENHHPMPHTTIHTTLTGEIILISLGSQTLQLMSPLVHDNRVVPHLNHGYHQHHLLLSELL